VNAVRLTDTSWLARADLKSNSTRSSTAFRATGGAVTQG